MTTINIYENKGNEEVYILQEEFNKELKDIKVLLTDLKKENLKLKQLILGLELKLTEDKVEDKKVEDNVHKQVKTVSANEIKTTSRSNRPLLKDEDKFKILPSSSKVLYNNITLLPTGELQHGSEKSRRKFLLKYNIYDLLYIKSLSDDDGFTMKDFRSIYEDNPKWSRLDLYKLIYNIRNNGELKKIMENARAVFEKDMKFTKKNDILYINGVNTEIPVHQARDWCNVYINSNKSRDVYIYELQKKFVKINKDYVAIIIYNHSNDELLDVLKKEKTNAFVENNPSKRKNLIMNGGLI